MKFIAADLGDGRYMLADSDNDWSMVSYSLSELRDMHSRGIKIGGLTDNGVALYVDVLRNEARFFGIDDIAKSVIERLGLQEILESDSAVYILKENSSFPNLICYRAVQFVRQNPKNSKYSILVEDMRRLFAFSSLGSLNLALLEKPDFSTVNAQFFDEIFMGYSSECFPFVDKFDLRNARYMDSMFEGSLLEELDLSSWNTSHVMDMCAMFADCKRLKKLNLSSLGGESLTDVNSMFFCCENLTELDLSSFNVSKVTNFQSMFLSCLRLKSLDLSSFDVRSATDVSSMFRACRNLEYLDLRNFKLPDNAVSYNMFMGCENLKNLVVSDSRLYQQAIADGIDVWSIDMVKPSDWLLESEESRKANGKT